MPAWAECGIFMQSSLSLCRTDRIACKGDSEGVQGSDLAWHVRTSADMPQSARPCTQITPADGHLGRNAH